MSMHSHFLCCWKRVFGMTIAFSKQNSVSLWPTSIYIPRPNMPVTPGMSWLPMFAFQSPMMRRTSFFFFFLVLVLEGLVGLHRTINLIFFGIRAWDITSVSVTLNVLPWKGTEIILSLLRLHPNTVFCLFVWLVFALRAIPFLLRDFLPILVDIMVTWIKGTHFCSF